MTSRFFNHFRDFSGDWRWPDFTPEEMACRGTGQLLIDPDAMDRLQELRDRLKRPLIVTSAFRSEQHNRAVGGARNSYHLRGQAFDISMNNHDPHDFIAQARDVEFNGIGQYADQGFVHIDTRTEPAEFGSRKFPPRPSRFAPEASPRPGVRAAKKTGTTAVVIGLAERTLQDAAPLVPDRWITLGAVALGLVSIAVIAWPLLRPLLRRSATE